MENKTIKIIIQNIDSFKYQIELINIKIILNMLR